MTLGQVSLPDDAVGTVLAAAADRLRRAGSATPGLDAELLAGAAFGLDRAQLRVRSADVPSADERERYEDYVVRRERQEPVAYILGRAFFRRLELTVDQRVLIPRPETEFVVEWGLEVVAQRQGAPGRVLDLCTGSGAIALALVDEAGPAVDVAATDLSGDALDVARANAQRLGLDVELLEGDLFEPVAGRRFDLITANPPYVHPHDASTLPSSVADYEPSVALFAELGGLHLLQRIISDAAQHLAPRGWLLVEVGAGQHGQVSSLFADAGYADVGVRNDLAGIPRVVGGMLLPASEPGGE